MAGQIGFDNELYLREQQANILKRVEMFGRKLYLEFGGKLLFDFHAARVLPGYDPNVKMRLLKSLESQAEIILCIHAGAIERRKVRADFGITYDVDALKLIDDLGEWGISVAGVVITRYEEQAAAKTFMNKLERRGIRVYAHRPTRGYPTNIDVIVSPDGYGANPYIETTKPLVVITGPGPGSGKLATCLSQVYHDHQRGLRSGYAKFETFPIWNLPLDHPVNIAYEAATADLQDYNLVDPHHLKAYKEVTVNYNRDVAAFDIVKCILERIMSAEAVYKSPTDMGVNRAGFAITNDDVVREAAKQEVIRRYFRHACEYAMGMSELKAVETLERLLIDLKLKPENRPVVLPARQAAAAAQAGGKGHDGIFCGAALQLPDGRIITGKNSSLMHAAPSLILNAAKELAGIPDKLHLLSPMIMGSISRFKREVLQKKNLSLDLEEALIALSISAATNPAAQMAMEKLPELRGCEMHMSHMPPAGDEAGLRRLGVNLTSDPSFSSRTLAGV